MTFDDWMGRENPAHRQSADSVQGRAFRRCWDAAVAAERERCARVCLGLWDLRDDERARLHAAKCASAILAEPPAIPTGDVQDSSWGEWQEAQG